MVDRLTRAHSHTMIFTLQSPAASFPQIDAGGLLRVKSSCVSVRALAYLPLKEVIKLDVLKSVEDITNYTERHPKSCIKPGGHERVFLEDILAENKAEMNQVYEKSSKGSEIALQR